MWQRLEIPVHKFCPCFKVNINFPQLTNKMFKDKTFHIITYQQEVKTLQYNCMLYIVVSIYTNTMSVTKMVIFAISVYTLISFIMYIFSTGYCIEIYVSFFILSITISVNNFVLIYVLFIYIIKQDIRIYICHQ